VREIIIVGTVVEVECLFVIECIAMYWFHVHLSCDAFMYFIVRCHTLHVVMWLWSHAQPLPSCFIDTWPHGSWSIMRGGFVRAYSGGWSCLKRARNISRPYLRIFALNVTSRDEIWQPCARGLILIDSVLWLGGPSPPRWGRDSSDFTLWAGRGTDHGVIQSVRLVGYARWSRNTVFEDIYSVNSIGVWILFGFYSESPISHRVELIGRLHWSGIAPINKSLLWRPITALTNWRPRSVFYSCEVQCNFW
jgi:hypothetical protein